MGPQFVHLQAFSIKPNRNGNSIDQVIGEAIRDPLFSTHIDDPKPPVTIFGVDLPELKIMHDVMLDQRKISVVVKGKNRKRAIRKDRNTLMTSISSFPVRIADLDKDGTGETRRMYEKWKQRNMEHWRSQFGDKLKTVIEHTDEEFPHLHAYILPDEDPGAFAILLHPGERAKTHAAEKAKADGLEGKEINKVANKAYQAAMSKWQDEFYEAVGAPCGLTRDGPKRARKTRAQWQTEKTSAAVTANVIEKNEEMAVQNKLEAKALAAKDEHFNAVEESFDDREAAIDAASVEIDRDRKALDADREKLNNDRKSFQSKIKSVRNRLRRVFEVMASKLGVSLTSNIEDDLNAFDDAVDILELENDHISPDM